MYKYVYMKLQLSDFMIFNIIFNAMKNICAYLLLNKYILSLIKICKKNSSFKCIHIIKCSSRLHYDFVYFRKLPNNSLNK